MVQKTKKVCIGTLQTHAKFQRIWFQFEILIFDPCFKKHTPNFFWDTLFWKKTFLRCLSSINMNLETYFEILNWLCLKLYMI